MPNGIAFGGPYYRSALRQGETQRRALTGRGYSPAELAGISRGELEARYTGEEARRRFQTEKEFGERRLGIYEEEAEAKKKAGIITGATGMAGLGYLGASALAGGAGGLFGIGTGAGTGAMLGLPAGPLGIIIGGLTGLIAGGK